MISNNFRPEMISNLSLTVWEIQCLPRKAIKSARIYARINHRPRQLCVIAFCLEFLARRDLQQQQQQHP